MASVTAEDVGKAMRVIADKMEKARIMTAEGSQVLTEESFKLTKLKGNTAWTTTVPRERPIAFERIVDANGQAVSIVLSADRIIVNQEDENLPPFSNLDVSIGLSHLSGDPVCRWHVDRANKDQPGPLFHLQFGGHMPGFRDRELPIAEPRWCHPPMELGLLCEVIAANFYMGKWSTSLREDPAWCGAIQKLQQLCYSAYARKLNSCLQVSSSTALGQMWNGRWT